MAAAVPWPGVSHLNLLVAGLLVGVLLSPAMLGAIAPRTYEAFFVGGGALAAQVAAEERAIQLDVERLQAVGVTDVAVQEQVFGRLEALAPRKVEVEQAKAARLARLRGWMGALVMASLLLMALETLVNPAPGSRQVPSEASPVPKAARGLVTARYGLMAVWLALGVARPDLLMELPWLFVTLLLLVALVAACVPLRSRKEPPQR